MPIGSLGANARTLISGTCDEAIVNEVHQIFCHLKLLHELVHVTVHAHKGTNVCKEG